MHKGANPLILSVKNLGYLYQLTAKIITYVCEMMTVQKEMGKWFNLPAIQSTQAYRVYVCNLGNRFEFMFIKMTCPYLRNCKPIGTMNVIVSLAVDWPVFR